MIKEVFEVVEKLNQEIYDYLKDIYGETLSMFEIRSDGLFIIIEFMGCYRLWFLDEDEREFYEDKDEYEPLEGYLRKEAQKIINQISSIKL